jgi:hypothetical protein
VEKGSEKKESRENVVKKGSEKKEGEIDGKDREG